jgi:hypothetical protein
MKRPRNGRRGRPQVCRGVHDQVLDTINEHVLPRLTTREEITYKWPMIDPLLYEYCDESWVPLKLG